MITKQEYLNAVEYERKSYAIFEDVKKFINKYINYCRDIGSLGFKSGYDIESICFMEDNITISVHSYVCGDWEYITMPIEYIWMDDELNKYNQKLEKEKEEYNKQQQEKELKLLDKLEKKYANIKR